MKKRVAQVQKLSLSRETLRSLDDRQAAEAAGGALTPSCTVGGTDTGHFSVGAVGCH